TGGSGIPITITGTRVWPRELTEVNCKNGYDNKGLNINRRETIKAQDDKIKSYQPFAWYDSYSVSENSWNDLSGNNRNATLANTVLDVSVFPKFLKGGTTGTVDISGNSWVGTNNSYTIIHITKYNGTSKGRIWNGKTENWLSGFLNGKVGFLHNSWLTISYAPDNTVPADYIANLERCVKWDTVLDEWWRTYYNTWCQQVASGHRYNYRDTSSKIVCKGYNVVGDYCTPYTEQSNSKKVGDQASDLGIGNFGQDWLLIVDQINYNVDGLARTNCQYGFTGGSKTAIPNGIGVNLGGEKSDWACYEMIIFNKALSLSEIRQIEKALIEKYSNVTSIANLATIVNQQIADDVALKCTGTTTNPPPLPQGLTSCTGDPLIGFDNDFNTYTTKYDPTKDKCPENNTGGSGVPKTIANTRLWPRDLTETNCKNGYDNKQAKIRCTDTTATPPACPEGTFTCSNNA
ncbi:hypothetical protein EBU71_19605, partial [bacterium]|nr:hypothetical protein [Candidatus Elulimicrobium humile]